MPVTVSYPGVYIEEIPSGVRTITGVATSITAFIGWSARGPVDRAQRVLSWPDFERSFGGLDSRSLLGYAVYQFFGNGGSDAYVIRLTDQASLASLVHPPGPPPPNVDRLTITAKNPGLWAHDYGIVTRVRADDPTRFRLAVVYAPAGPASEVIVESFENLSMATADRRFVQTVVNAESQLVDVAVTGGTVPPNTPTPSPRLAGGSDGTVLEPTTAAFRAQLNSSTGGFHHLDRVDLFNLLCVPGLTDATTVGTLQDYCRERRAFLIADCASNATFSSLQSGPSSGLTGDDAINAAFYFPWLEAPDPRQEGRPRALPPCGFVAGVYARTDATRGVFKAPAGTDASVTGVLRPRVTLTDSENGILNVQAINCIRTFPVYGTVLWGARTLHGHDERGSEWKYIPGAPSRPLHRRESLPRHQVGRLRAQRRAAVGADPAQRGRLHAGPLPTGRLPGPDAARSVSRKVRPRDHHAARHQPRRGQHPGRIRTAQARRVRDHPDPAARWSGRGVSH